MNPRLVKLIKEYVEALLIAALLALFIRSFVVKAYKIPSGSMLETLQIGDHLLVNKFLYGVKLPFTDFTVIPISEPSSRTSSSSSSPRTRARTSSSGSSACPGT